MGTRNILLLVGAIIAIVLIVLLLKKPKKKTGNAGNETAKYGYVPPTAESSTLDKMRNNFDGFLKTWTPIVPNITQADITTLATADDIKRLQNEINLASQKTKGRTNAYGVTAVAITGTMNAGTGKELVKIDATEGNKVFAQNNITKRQVDYFIETLNDD